MPIARFKHLHIEKRARRDTRAFFSRHASTHSKRQSDHFAASISQVWRSNRLAVAPEIVR
jgi:hypothetical protein